MDAVIAWRTQALAVGDMVLQLIQMHEETGVGLEVGYPHCGVKVKGEHFGAWSPWDALNQILRPDLKRLQTEGMGVLSELDINTEVALRCFAPHRWDHTRWGSPAVIRLCILPDRRAAQAQGQHAGEAGEIIHVRDVRQPAAAASAGGDEHNGVGHPGTGGVGDGRR